MTRTALILGGSGRFGRHAAQAFRAAGWQTRPFDRRRDDLVTAARDAQVIVNGFNPPYPRWAAEMPSLHAGVRHAALETGATVILPGNVYVFGKDAPERLGPATPHRATNPLGRLRVEMEAAYRESGVRTILLRAGDFLDTQASGNWFDKVMAASLGKGVLTAPGNPAAPHAWAFLPDMARAAVELAGRRETLPRFADIPFPGYTLSTAEMAGLLSGVLGRDIRVKRMAWWPLLLAQPVWPMARHLHEMRYLWDKPHHMDAGAFEALLPGFRATPVAEALRQALSGPGAGEATPPPAAKPPQSGGSRSTQTSRWRLAASAVPSPGQTTPAPVTRQSAEGST